MSRVRDDDYNEPVDDDGPATPEERAAFRDWLKGQRAIERANQVDYSGEHPRDRARRVQAEALRSGASDSNALASAIESLLVDGAKGDKRILLDRA